MRQMSIFARQGRQIGQGDVYSPSGRPLRQACSLGWADRSAIDVCEVVSANPRADSSKPGGEHQKWSGEAPLDTNSCEGPRDAQTAYSGWTAQQNCGIHMQCTQNDQEQLVPA